MNPLRGDLFADIGARGDRIELTKLSAYSARYAGYGIKEGRITLDVKYHVENGKMEVRAKVTETDRDNLKAGQKATVQIDALPGHTFTAKVGALSGGASRGEGFTEMLSERFAAPVEGLDPFKRVGFDPKKFQVESAEDVAAPASMSSATRRLPSRTPRP